MAHDPASEGHTGASETPKAARAVITDYFPVVNAALLSGNFDALLGLYAADATLSQSCPLGVTKVYQGRAAIRAFYASLPVKAPGVQLNLDSMRGRGPGVILTYEHASAPQWTVLSRCAHVFTVRDGEIQSHDFIVYLGGHP